MLHSRIMNNEINLLHKRAPRIVCFDCESSFCNLLEKDGSFCFYHRNFIERLATKTYTFLRHVSTTIMDHIIKLSQKLGINYVTSPKTVKLGADTISFNSFSKNCTSFSSLEINIKNGKQACPCWLCQHSDVLVLKLLEWNR